MKPSRFTEEQIIGILRELSRNHFMIEKGDGSYYVRDLRSTLGTIVNGEIGRRRLTIYVRIAMPRPKNFSKLKKSF